MKLYRRVGKELILVTALVATEEMIIELPNGHRLAVSVLRDSLGVRDVGSGMLSIEPKASNYIFVTPISPGGVNE